MASNKLRVAILGASGYTGAELVRLLARHPHVAKFYQASQNEGGAGATIVELRE
jgi:N-acetyl-gamma-glutamylphosphate reductase